MMSMSASGSGRAPKQPPGFLSAVHSATVDVHTTRTVLQQSLRSPGAHAGASINEGGSLLASSSAVAARGAEEAEADHENPMSLYTTKFNAFYQKRLQLKAEEHLRNLANSVSDLSARLYVEGHAAGAPPVVNAAPCVTRCAHEQLLGSMLYRRKDGMAPMSGTPPILAADEFSRTMSVNNNEFQSVLSGNRSINQSWNGILSNFITSFITDPSSSFTNTTNTGSTVAGTMSVPYLSTAISSVVEFRSTMPPVNLSVPHSELPAGHHSENGSEGSLQATQLEGGPPSARRYTAPHTTSRPVTPIDERHTTGTNANNSNNNNNSGSAINNASTNANSSSSHNHHHQLDDNDDHYYHHNNSNMDAVVVVPPASRSRSRSPSTTAMSEGIASILEHRRRVQSHVDHLMRHYSGTRNTSCPTPSVDPLLNTNNTVYDSYYYTSDDDRKDHSKPHTVGNSLYNATISDGAFNLSRYTTESKESGSTQLRAFAVVGSVAPRDNTSSSNNVGTQQSSDHAWEEGEISSGSALDARAELSSAAAIARATATAAPKPAPEAEAGAEGEAEKKDEDAAPVLPDSMGTSGSEALRNSPNSGFLAVPGQHTAVVAPCHGPASNSSRSKSILIHSEDDFIPVESVASSSNNVVSHRHESIDTDVVGAAQATSESFYLPQQHGRQAVSGTENIAHPQQQGNYRGLAEYCQGLSKKGSSYF